MHDKGRLSTDRSRPVIKATDWRGKLVAIVGKDVAEYCIAEFTKRNHAAGNNPLLKTHANSVIRTLLIKYTDVTVRTILQVFEIGMGRYQKIKKDGSGQTPELSFVENPDILATVAQSAAAQKGELFCVGFAAESHDLLAHATAKRLRKQVPLIVGNIGPATFGQDDNALLLVDEKGARELPQASKQVLAVQLIEDIARRLG